MSFLPDLIKLSKAILVISVEKKDCSSTTESDASYPDTIYGNIRLTGSDDSATVVNFYRISDDVSLLGPDNQPQSAMFNYAVGYPSDFDVAIGFSTVKRNPALLYYYAVLSGSIALLSGDKSIPYKLDFNKNVNHLQTSRTIEDYEICYPQPSSVLPANLAKDIKSYVAHNIPDSMTPSADGSNPVFSFTYWTSLTPKDLDDHMTQNRIEANDAISRQKRFVAYKAKLAAKKRHEEIVTKRNKLVI